MAAVMPAMTPWMSPPRGSSDGVKERHPKMIAPQQPGSVKYSSFRGFRCLAGGGGSSAEATAVAVPPAVAVPAAVAASPDGPASLGGPTSPSVDGWPTTPVAGG